MKLPNMQLSVDEVREALATLTSCTIMRTPPITALINRMEAYLDFYFNETPGENDAE